MTETHAANINHGIEIEVKTHYLKQQSQPDNEKYVFAYTINIRNVGAHKCQLITRHWVITESDFSVQEVHGEGVVGKQPIIEPGKSFEYTSAAILKTEVGTMKGFYDMLGENGQIFKAAIPQFTLSVPRVLQ